MFHGVHPWVFLASSLAPWSTRYSTKMLTPRNAAAFPLKSTQYSAQNHSRFRLNLYGLRLSSDDVMSRGSSSC